MNTYKKANIITGWLVFLVAAVTYLLTIEPTTSLWDCGEFIASAYKLQVGHPPGAPFFMLIARLFSLFASDKELVAMMVNAMSGLASAFTILFLFWSITHLAKKLIIKADNDYSPGNIIAVLGAGLVGALAYTFSDTFWFSAVEGEVYATSSLFTAIVFWAILKWENQADDIHASKWLILIAYLMGLSIGVHLLNLLAIPAIVMVIYLRKYKPTPLGIIVSLGLSALILAFIMYGLIPGLITMASKFELLFVNGFGLAFNYGLLIHIMLLIVAIITGLYITYTEKSNKFLLAFISAGIFLLSGLSLIFNNLFLAFLLSAIVFIVVYYWEKPLHKLLNTAFLIITVLVIGYSTFSIIFIRSLADPPMDENNPEQVFAMLYYLNREQYGDRPLVYGQYFNAPVTEYKKGKPVYVPIGNKYEITDYKTEPVYDERFTTLFPRMWSSQGNHVKEYKNWVDIKGTPITFNRGGKSETRYKPTMGENLTFFFRYQIGHMYLRYFMWNFAGRQNNIQSHGELTNGNWISGIPLIDKYIEGPQENMPNDIKNAKSRNTFYFLPLILGLLGMIFQYRKKKEDFWVVMLLFILTGIAIVVYLNQYPLQPRERDYAYAASFYAFAIWIGLGVLFLFNGLANRLSKPAAAVTSVLICFLLVPTIMAKENWDDHDRSGRYTARDIAKNYLNSCAPNAILFTNGDNDTFPLWYAQEVEGIRTDVRVVNLMLLNMDWYIEQMKRKAYESEPLPISLEFEQFMTGTRDMVIVYENTKNYVDLKRIMEFVASDNERTKVQSGSGQELDYVPTKHFILPVDKETVLSNGTVKPADSSLIVDEIRWPFNQRHLGKSDLIVLDMLAHNNWERPVYFVSTGHEGTLGLDDYLQLEGLAYRLVPIETPRKDFLSTGRIDTDILYENFMEKFSYGRMNAPDVYLDNFHTRTFSIIRLRNRFSRLAESLVKEGKEDKAIEVLDYCIELIPHEKIPYDPYMFQIIEQYYKLDETEKANTILKNYYAICDAYLKYYSQFEDKKLSQIQEEIKRYFNFLYNLATLASQYGEQEMSEDIQMKLNSYYQMLGPKIQQ